MLLQLADDFTLVCSYEGESNLSSTAEVTDCSRFRDFSMGVWFLLVLARTSLMTCCHIELISFLGFLLAFLVSSSLSDTAVGSFSETSDSFLMSSICESRSFLSSLILIPHSDFCMEINVPWRAFRRLRNLPFKELARKNVPPVRLDFSLIIQINYSQKKSQKLTSLIQKCSYRYEAKIFRWRS